jgi:hypothetical protein
MRAWFAKRFAGADSYELWGYAVWFGMGLVIVVPEVTAAIYSAAPWPTISGMTGHLEARWAWVALIVVALIVFAAYHALRFPVTKTGPLAKQADDRELGRTDGGRFTRAPGAADPQDVPSFYFPFALVAVLAPSIAVAVLVNRRFMLAYVLYGTIALFWVAIPSVLAYWFARDVPWPTLFATIANLQRRLHLVGVIVAIGLSVLAIHLALYPWPSIINDLQQLHAHNHQVPVPVPSPHSP